MGRRGAERVWARVQKLGWAPSGRDAARLGLDTPATRQLHQRTGWRARQVPLFTPLARDPCSGLGPLRLPPCRPAARTARVLPRWRALAAQGSRLPVVGCCVRRSALGWLVGGGGTPTARAHSRVRRRVLPVWTTPTPTPTPTLLLSAQVPGEHRAACGGRARPPRHRGGTTVGCARRAAPGQVQHTAPFMNGCRGGARSAARNQTMWPRPTSLCMVWQPMPAP